MALTTKEILMPDAAWVANDHDHGPYAISLHATAGEAAKSSARQGYGRVARWDFGAEFGDAIREWEGR